MRNSKKIARIILIAFGLLVVFGLAMPFLANPAHAAETVAPSSYQSLQPFEHFAKGEGEGVAYEYRIRSKEQLVVLLRDKALAKKSMRVPCETLVRQMMEGHKDLPFEGCEGAAAAIERDNDFAVVACRDEMFQENFLAVTNEKGTAWGVWHRKCMVSERVLVYKDQPLISLTCLNVAIPVAIERTLRKESPPVATPPAPTPLAKAPTLSQYGLQINYMSDRPNGFWRDRYEAAKALREQNLMRENLNKKGMLPYYEVFTQAPFGNMLAERKSRPLDGKFLVRFLKKEPVLDIRSGDSADERAQKYNEYLRQWQQPLENNVLAGQWVSTGSRGWVIVPITFPLDQFEAALVQPEQIGQVLEPVIAVHRPEFATQSNPIHIWEVR